ncbi:MAG TPA: permease-like cell division protein FtsX [Nocardioidaceae bacterium]|jgi:cell division transport system permease protein|nr:permease-like cell division protein FtsX [Nocardioidaceae bacterium]
MQLTYVFSELGNGLRRNVSMTIAVVVTIFVSLTLVGMGLLLNAQAHKAEEYWGSKLQITVFLCNQNSTSANCVNGEVTGAQKDQIEKVLNTHPEVASWHLESKQEAYRKWKSAYVSDDATERRVYESIKPSDMQESYWVQLKDPERFQGIKSAVQGLPGVNAVRDLREVLKPIYFWMNVMKWGAISVAGFLVFAAVLQVSNTIRLAAFARRREIGIMRLVGASSLYIQLPFLMESLVAALVGVALSAAAIGTFMYVVIYQMLRPTSNIVAWIDWGDGLWAMGWIALIGLGLTLLPTLVMTRKYLRV